jgi:hypothetical protein
VGRFHFIFEDCTFKRNTASEEGGAVSSCHIAGGGVVDFRNTLLEANVAKRGGAIFSDALQINFHNVTFAVNTASEKVSACPPFCSPRLNWNTTYAQGGALWLQSAQVSGNSVAFLSNEAATGGAVFTSKSTVITFFDGTFASNAAKDGSDMLFGENDTAHNAIVLNNCTALNVTTATHSRRLSDESAVQGYSLGTNSFLVFDKRSHVTVQPDGSINTAIVSDCGVTADVSWVYKTKGPTCECRAGRFVTQLDVAVWDSASGKYLVSGF